MGNIFSKFFGSYNDKELKRISPMIKAIAELEPAMKALSDSGLRAKTEEFKKRYQSGESLDELLVPAFAALREGGVRVLGQRAFDTQLLGAIVLHQGRIAELKTGEGKTLAAVFAAYLNAISGKGVHVVTVNDYLAKSQGELMGLLYNFMGLSVGIIIHGITNQQRKAAYDADVTYGTNNEFGFDYLRDNMVSKKSDMVQRGHAYAIVDEVDSILIDEARTPLIISGQGDKSTKLYEVADQFAQRLKPFVIAEQDTKTHDHDIDGDYIVDEKARTATLTERGVHKAEAAFGIENLSDPENSTISHHINIAIRARGIMKRDIDYVVKDGQIIIVDEFTGRMMLGRRYSDGLHQAIEAKEKVKVERESKTLATITLQNYFRLYDKLSGMTGTAKTEENEFKQIYKQDVVIIPTNKPMIRIDHPDAVYKNQQAKLNAIVKQVMECNAKGQPVLLGTVSIEKSEVLSKELKKNGIKHEVLNAKHHDKEAEIVAQAGRHGAVTIATNMAGRGTDILLGGNPSMLAKNEMRKQDFSEDMLYEASSAVETDNEEILNARKVYSELRAKYKQQTEADKQKVIEAGGLFILGSERHESRRIDNQLRGRSGRQGDVGESRFFISLDDDLMRLFGSERIAAIVERLGMADDDAIEHKMMSSAIENAQKKIEGRNFDVRKHVLQYDDVMNLQRTIIYKQRLAVLNEDNIKDNIINMLNGMVDNIVEMTIGGQEFTDNWSFETLFAKTQEIFGVALHLTKDEQLALDREKLHALVSEVAHAKYNEKEQEFGEEGMARLSRMILLYVVDEKWMDHIDAMDQLRHGIGLRAYGQHDPVMEYKKEGSDMFDAMVDTIKEDTVKYILHAKLTTQVEGEKTNTRVSIASHGGDAPAKAQPTRINKTGRNDLCPCGSGKKYKKCCGE